MSGPRIGSLCSGFGGLDLAVMDTLGGTVAWHAQYDPDDKQQYAAKILDYRWPGVPNHGDITAIDYADVEQVDVLTAGFPCQPVSNAGRRQGQDDDRWIWPAVAGAVCVLRPRLVVLENVAALVVRGLPGVLADLAACGYVGSWRCVRASDVGAPHRRERIFIVARPAAEDPDRAARRQRRIAAPGQAEGGRPRADARGRGRAPAAGPDSSGSRLVQCDGRDPLGGRSSGVPVGPDRVAWGPYAPAIDRWARVLGRQAPPPVDSRGRLSPPFVEWMMGAPDGWVTDVPDIPRNAQLKALGNGVVRQQGAAGVRILAGRAGFAVRSP